MSRIRDDGGYTLVEVMVAISLFSIISIGFYQVMFSGVTGSETARDVSRISEEARLGFNRMVRDTRETAGHCFGATDPSCGLVRATATSYEVEIDFNGDGDVDYDQDEYLRYSFDAVAGTISVEALAADETTLEGPDVLVEGVEQIDPDGVSGPLLPEDVFQYTSNHLEYDYLPTGAPDGVTTSAEIDTPPAGVSDVGDGDGVLDGRGDDNPREVLYISNIIYSFNVRQNERVSTFYAEASMRNRRWATQ